MEKTAQFLKETNISWLEKTVVNPDTGRKVKVKSLPANLRMKYRPKTHANVEVSELNTKIKNHKQNVLDRFYDLQKTVKSHDPKGEQHKTTNNTVYSLKKMQENMEGIIKQQGKVKGEHASLQMPTTHHIVKMVDKLKGHINSHGLDEHAKNGLQNLQTEMEHFKHTPFHFSKL